VLLTQNLWHEEGNSAATVYTPAFNLANNSAGTIKSVCYSRTRVVSEIEVEFEVSDLLKCPPGVKSKYTYKIRPELDRNTKARQFPLIPAFARSAMAAQSTSLPYVHIRIDDAFLDPNKDKAAFFYVMMSRARGKEKLWIEGLDSLLQRNDGQLKEFLKFANCVDEKMVQWEQRLINEATHGKSNHVLKLLSKVPPKFLQDAEVLKETNEANKKARNR